MRIVHVSEYATGGVATYLRTIIPYQLKDEDIEKVILFSADSNSENINFSSNKFEKHLYKYKRSFFGILKLFRLRRDIDKLNPDIVHLHSSFAGLIRFTFFIKKPKYKVIYCAHGWSFLQKDKNKLLRYLYSITERLEAIATDLIINISCDEQKMAIKNHIPKNKMKIIYNSILPVINRREIKNPFLSDGKKLMFIGRFDSQKGLDALLENFDFDNSNIELVVIGEPVISNSARSYDSTKNIKFLGWIDHDLIDSYMYYTDALIVPSFWEGFGLVALEAMKNKKMVLASDLGGLSEMIKDNYNGLKFNPSSRMDVNRVLTSFENMSKNEINKLGSNGYDFFKHKYNSEKLCLKLDQSYKQILDYKC